MDKKIQFAFTYWFGNPPWDTGITPPELHQFLESNPPGRALDLGCGTGTNVITLAEQGWYAEGIDFVPRAVRIAKRKSRKAGLSNRTKFQVGDILSPVFFQGEYDLILDIGCFHNILDEKVNRYLDNVSGHLAPGGKLLLYVHLNEENETGHGASEKSLEILGERLRLVKRTDGEESSRPSAWLEYRRDLNQRAE